jgi:simple sugar transport system substrate-binding protein/ribose transport system substrate-binding protein
MGIRAVESVERILLKNEPKGAITSGPYLFMDASLVDGNNVRRFL